MCVCLCVSVCVSVSVCACVLNCQYTNRILTYSLKKRFIYFISIIHKEPKRRTGEKLATLRMHSSQYIHKYKLQTRTFVAIVLLIIKYMIVH